MIDMNDPEVIESLKYLLVSKEERIRIQTMPFDAKKNCFIPDPKDSFVAGEITGTEGNMVICKNPKGEVNIYEKNSNIKSINTSPFI
jgi:hypothetical protein